MLLHPLKNDRGLALVFMILLFVTAATASVMFISLGIKIKGIQREGTTQQRLVEIRTALQNYYLIHYTLPEPSLTNPPNSVPTDLLNLPQKYRFDSNGQMIHYDRLPSSGHMITVRNVNVHGTNAVNLVAAVLVAPGPDKNIDPNNQAAPYDDPANPENDDIVLAVSLEVEALKIASHTVALLQQTAKAYDANFYGINNDIDTLYYPPETNWVDLTPPSHSRVWQQTGVDPVSGNPVYGWVEDGTWHNNYAGDNEITYHTNDITSSTGGSTTSTLIDLDDEYVEPFLQDNPYFPQQPEAIIDEDGYVASQGGAGSGCVRIPDVTGGPTGTLLSNDPDRGVASLDMCSSGTPAYDLAVVYGLNLIKLGYYNNGFISQLLDPWGNQYLWGDAATYGTLVASNTWANDQVRDHHYWSFFSQGPDLSSNTVDDILPSADRIPGYFLTPPIPNPIP